MELRTSPEALRSHSTSENNSQKFSRRTLFAVGGTAVMGGAIAGLGANRLFGGKEAPSVNTGNGDKNPSDSAVVAGGSTTVETQTSQVVTEEPLVEQGDVAMTDYHLTRTPNLLADYEGQDPDIFYYDSNEESSKELEKAFTLTTEEVPEPEEYAGKFLPLFGSALTLGCTAKDAEPFLVRDETGQVADIDTEGYFAAMDEKYTIPAFSSLFRKVTAEVESNPDFKKFRNARHNIGLHFLKHAYKTGTADNVPIIRMTSREQPSVKGTGYFTSRIGVLVTNNLGDNDPTKEIYEAKGTISVGVDPKANGRLEAGLAVNDPWDKLFNDLSDINN